MSGHDPNDPNFNQGFQRSQQFTPGVSPPGPTPGGRDTVVHLMPNVRLNSGHAAMTMQQVRSMQQFLMNHGFNVAQDGVFGPQTKAAALAFRANHKGGEAFNAKHGTGTYTGGPAGVTPHGTAADTPAPTRTLAGAAPPGGVDAGSAINTLLQSLLSQGGAVGSTFDPGYYGDAAAAPQNAVAAALAKQVAANPGQEKQNQADISNWYGLDPNDPNFKLSVLGRLKTAAGRDQAAATGAATNDSALAQALASSVGGSANDGSGQIAAAGENAAGTANALGAASAQYASDMNPLIAAEARSKSVDEKGTNSKALQALQDSLAQARGQAAADRAGAVGTVTDKNNSILQQRFANKGNLLSTLTQLAAVDPQSQMLKDALTQAKIKKTNAETNKIVSGKTTAGHVFKIDVGKAAGGIARNLGYTDGGTGTGVAMVPTADHQRLANQIGAFLRSQGFKPGDGQFKHIGDALLSTFVDQHGRPIQAPPDWQI
jgi:hypothetical protein